MPTTIASLRTTELSLTSFSTTTNPVYIEPGAGISVTSGVALYVSTGHVWEIENFGSIVAPDIDGAVRLGGGLLFNEPGATISGGYGVYVLGDAAIANYGTILGTGSYGVLDRQIGSTLSVANYGLISGSGSHPVDYGIELDGSGSFVRNTGTILASQTGIELPFGGTVVNSGSVGGFNSVLIDEFTDGALVVVDPGAVFSGAVQGGGGKSDFLQFASGSRAGTLSGLGGHYSGFIATTIDAGAQWTATGSNSISKYYDLIDDGHLTIAGSLGGLGTVSLAHGVTLDVASTGTLTAPVSGLSGGTIALLGQVETYAALHGGELTLSGGTTLDVPGLEFARVTEGGGDTFITACFAAGTRIMGAFGPVPVEALAVGDRVRTARGRLAPVRWLGHRRVDLARHKRPLDVMPVRVRRAAFGRGRPSRDLVLSPDHAVFFRGHLVPVRHLINGVSIVQETRERITYWHVELDRHDVILAEDLPCESYLDTGNRAAFENAAGAVQMTPDFARAVWAAEGCAPILTDPAAPRLRAMHARLLARAVAARNVATISVKFYHEVVVRRDPRDHKAQTAAGRA
jgi:hypothetical protein